MSVVDGHDVQLSPGRKRNIRKTLVMQQMLKWRISPKLTPPISNH